MLRSGLALLMILLAAPASYAASRAAGGGFHGGGFHGGGGGYHGGGYNGGGGYHSGAVAFHRGGGRARGFSAGYGLGYGLGLGYGSGGVYDSGYGYGYGGAENAIGGSEGYTGGYVPDPEGADIPPVIFPTSCWVRRVAYDPSGAYVGQVLVDLCRPSDRVTVTGQAARAKTPDAGKATSQPAPADRPSAPQPKP
jgi:hypothetical protein